MVIDTDTVKRVANLARIHVTEPELIPLSKQLSTILEFMHQLNEVDIKDIEPLTSVTPMDLKLRDDTVTDGEKTKQILMNAPSQSDGFFAVPKMIE